MLALWQAAEALPTNTDDGAAIRLLIAHPAAVLLLALEADLLVGTVIAGFDGWRGGIYRLAVRPSHRRRGIAGTLVAEAARRLEAFGARRLAAFARAEEAHALAFWDSGAGAGFERGPDYVRYVRG